MMDCPTHSGGSEHPNESGRCFAESYASRHGICREGFVLSVFQRTLHPHVRPLFSLINEIRPLFFSADYDFIVAVGQMRRFSDYETATLEFATHPANRGFLRRWLRLRVSVRRMRWLVLEIYVRRFFVLPSDGDDGSLSPFEHNPRLASPTPRPAPGIRPA